jgi:hypothetical protein
MKRCLYSRPLLAAVAAFLFLCLAVPRHGWAQG